MAHKLTGRERYRVLSRWRKPDLLVLQVERTGIITSWSAGMIDSRTQTWWEDCKPEWKLEKRQVGLTPRGKPMPQTMEEWQNLYSLAEEKMLEMSKENSKLRSLVNDLQNKLKR